ncbi:hypothetical protein MCOR23_010222 [Pyricularia oryzae]|nr:hypothetical protein MCOR30_009268 [Pyricularia oryzae]KAI6389315.1 hypothetical protein MCOR23_010222 [Pyricularia oryzae]KAI6498635.1 hypothetical protein MCOR11_003877 [Pyricularia oryzae]KAI6582760.1 hypothetical protein MCOR06_008390 [Pyricularia oryzae]
MAPAPPPLPTRFPCWCRAVYSWGGESKRDLGFIEGDLIECLNAGDGSWWTGRLRRDRRMVGVFPSNFVELLPHNFRPMSRSTSPLPQNNTPSPKDTPQKSRTFRKPFEAYAKAPHYTTAKQPETYKESPTHSRDASATSVAARAPSPAPPRAHHQSSHHQSSHRAVSPAPTHRYDDMRRAASPAPSHRYDDIRRAASPAPTQRYNDMRRAASPAPSHRYDDMRRAASPAPLQRYEGMRRAASPAPLQRYEEMRRAVSPGGFDAFGSRAPSPAPSDIAYKPYRPSVGSFDSAQQLNLQDGPESPPPPAPPPHRHVPRHNSNMSYDSQNGAGLERHVSNLSYDNRQAGLSRHGSNVQYDHQQPEIEGSRHGSNVPYGLRTTGYHTPRAPSPCPPSPGLGRGGMTPSPLREAMDGVMEQLGALGLPPQDPSPEPTTFDPWSPESFDMVHQQSRRRNNKKEQLRPQTSMGIARADSGYETYSGGSSQGGSQENTLNNVGHDPDELGLPQLSNYVERMETRLRNMHNQSSSRVDDEMAPPPPPKSQAYERPKSSMGGSIHGSSGHSGSQPKLRHRKSAYDVGRQVLGRTFTTKTNSTSTSSGNQSTTTQSTSHSLMSGASAGGISATSAGSLARKNQHRRAQSAMSMREPELDRPETPFTGVTYHSSHASDAQVTRPKSQVAYHNDDPMANIGGLGGLTTPKTKKSNFFKKILESAKTGVASTRGSIATAGAGSMNSPRGRSTPNGFIGIAGGLAGPGAGRDTAREMGLGAGVDWVQIRRDVNRSNTLSRNERSERRERCQMMDYPALDPVDELYGSIDGDEGADGMAVAEPMNYAAINLSQVDKNSRFISGLPPTTTSITLATTYVCRPYRSDVQRLRAIFTWVAEKICWEEDFEGQIDTRRSIASKRGCAEEYAVLVYEMCAAVGIHCEVVRGYLKSPGEVPEMGLMPRSNHWWNAVLVDNEWRMIDACLASPSNPQRGLYSSAGSGVADAFWFLTRPTEICWTHIPEHHGQQHICPPVAHEILLNLPCASPPYFRNGLHLVDYNTSLTRIEDLEMVHVKFTVPEDVEVAAEVEVRAFSRDADGDIFESGDVVKKRALAQADWVGGEKRYTVKALLPGDEGTGVLKVYAGKRGLMHSIKDIPHPVAFAVPIMHTGENPPYEFVTRHPTPHAQRHDIYVVQPQCQRLALNNTFVFAIRQHPSSLGTGSAMTPSSNPGGASPIPFARPGSAMSMTSSSAAGSMPSSASTNGSGVVSGKKPAKLAIQTPGGKILRLMRKEERRNGAVGVGGRTAGSDEDASDGGTWETIIKCSEKGVWRGLVLADRTARWCVFAEWVCDG